MSIYEELATAERDFTKRWRDGENLVRLTIGNLIAKFTQHCEIPPGRIKFLKRDRDSSPDTLYSPPIEDGSAYTWMGALTFCDDGFWRVGLKVLFSERSIPEHFIFFHIGATVRNGKVLAELPGGKECVVNLDDPSTLMDYVEKVVGMARELFQSDPIAHEISAAQEKTHGFDIGPVAADQPLA